MKKMIRNFTFSASTKQITFSDYATIDLRNVLLITNVTDNVIIYNFASSALGGTVSGNILTLTYNTSSMSDSDSIQIFYDVLEENPATEETSAEQGLLQKLLMQLLDRLDFGLLTDKTKTLRVQLNPDLTSTIAAVTTVTTVGTLSAITRQGDLQMQRINEAILDTAFINGITNNVAF